MHVGILDGSQYSEPDAGTVQGSSLSPLLGNIYLHHVLDLWFERDVRPRMRSKACLIRYADDFVIGFEREDDAKRVMAVVQQRFERFGLRLHPEKTRLLPFARPQSGKTKGKGPATFDFLGFTVYWRRSLGGQWTPAYKTRRARLRRAILALAEFCRRQRHLPVKQQHTSLVQRINGHFNYFGVNGNSRSMGKLLHYARRAWRKWLSRRSQRAYLSWKRFEDLARDYPLPRPTIRVRLWINP